MSLALLPRTLAVWTALALRAQQVITVRPPAGSLRRGLVAVPPGPTAALLCLATAGLIAYAFHTRRRRRP